MAEFLTGRLRFIAFANLAFAFLTPIRILIHLASASTVFSVAYAGAAIVCLILFALGFGVMTGYTGLMVYHGRPEALKWTMATGGLSLGYCAVGVFLIVEYKWSRDGLDTVIRRGSEDWWYWSISHYQNPAFVDIAIALWWIYCTWVVVRCMKESGSRFDLVRLVYFVIFGAILRFVHLANDVALYSQR